VQTAGRKGRILDCRGRGRARASLHGCLLNKLLRFISQNALPAGIALPYRAHQNPPERNDLGTYFENKTGRRTLGDRALAAGWMSVTVAVSAEVTTHLRLDMPVVRLHVHNLHEFYPRG